jgi:hypothetical protein
MPQRERARAWQSAGRVGAILPVVATSFFAACQAGSARFPWPAGGSHIPAEHAEVRTLNQNYDRSRSGVLVREIDRPTRAALDYAAYHANFMIADLPPAPLAPTPPSRNAPDTSNPFQGLVERATLTGDVKRTPLTEGERTHPLAFAPAVEFLHSRRVPGAETLEQLGGAVRSESWGLPHPPEATTQTLAEMFLHESGPGNSPEIWVKIEFVPWFKAFRDLPDQDGDGFPEVYGRVRADAGAADTIAVLEHDYMGRVLGPAEMKAWANQLSSYWYPSFNTDLIAPEAQWPDERTEADIKQELGGRVFPAPAIVLRGKPQGRATYDVFLIKPRACGDDAPCALATAGPGANVSGAAGRQVSGSARLPRTHPTPQFQTTMETVTRELAEHGAGSWAKWVDEVAPLHDAIRARLRSTPAQIKAFVGANGFLFYRNGLEFVTGGDLEKQRKGKNPLPIIVEFKNELESHDVDFLFVPVPTKEEIFPDEFDARYKALAGQIVNPFFRKFQLSLAQAGVEVVDLLPAFLAARTGSDGGEQEPIYQHQDTHWTDRGLRLAADIIGARIKKYPWYREVRDWPGTEHVFTSRESSTTRFGDLYSRLPEAEKRPYRPETLVAHQVFTSNGAPYEDDSESPVVVLGDSFTGVYELTDAEHAGVSAHLAKGLSFPVDLVMSYGGGPNVRQKLLRRGKEALASKRLVVWIMTARDLYNYWDDWAPLESK